VKNSLQRMNNIAHANSHTHTLTHNINHQHSWFFHLSLIYSSLYHVLLFDSLQHFLQTKPGRLSDALVDATSIIRANLHCSKFISIPWFKNHFDTSILLICKCLVSHCRIIQLHAVSNHSCRINRPGLNLFEQVLPVFLNEHLTS